MKVIAFISVLFVSANAMALPLYNLSVGSSIRFIKRIDFPAQTTDYYVDGNVRYCELSLKEAHDVAKYVPVMFEELIVKVVKHGSNRVELMFANESPLKSIYCYSAAPMSIQDFETNTEEYLELTQPDPVSF